MHLERRKGICEEIIWILTVVLFSSFTILGDNTRVSIILLVITSCIFVLDALQENGKLNLCVGAFHYHIVMFALYCIVSSIWALRSSEAIQKGITIIEILVCMSVIFIHYSKAESIQPLVSVVMWSGYFVVIYTFAFYGIDTVKYMLAQGERLENSFANINTIGMLAAISVILTCFKICYIKNRFSIDNILAVPCIIIIAASGSRKALIMIVLGVAMILMKRYSSSNLLKNIFICLVSVIILIFIVHCMSKLSMFKGIMERMQGMINLLLGTGKVEHSAWLREQYINIGIEQFKRTPLLGIGIGSSGELLLQKFGVDTYLHNNFVELLACGGLVGFGIYYSIYYYLIKKLRKAEKKGLTDPYVTLSIILIIVLLFMDYGSVSYYSKERYFYFAMLFLEVEFLNIYETGDVYSQF